MYGFFVVIQYIFVTKYRKNFFYELSQIRKGKIIENKNKVYEYVIDQIEKKD